MPESFDFKEYARMMLKQMEDQAITNESLRQDIKKLEITLATMSGKVMVVSAVCGTIGAAVLTWVFSHVK